MVFHFSKLYLRLAAIFLDVCISSIGQSSCLVLCFPPINLCIYLFTYQTNKYYKLFLSALCQLSHIAYTHSGPFSSDPDKTVYRYLCAERSIGSIIGKGGEIVKKLRADSQAKITIAERIPGSKERVVTISSSGEKTNIFGNSNDYICPAQDALFRLHERLVRNDPSYDEDVDTVASHASVRLLVPSDQVGHVIGKGGHIIQEIRSNTGANIRILKDEHLPFANSSDELLQVS